MFLLPRTQLHITLLYLYETFRISTPHNLSTNVNLYAYNFMKASHHSTLTTITKLVGYRVSSNNINYLPVISTAARRKSVTSR